MNSRDAIEDHKKALMMSGNLSNFHLENIKKWPHIIFDDLDSFVVNFNFIDQNGGTDGVSKVFAGVVVYDLQFKDGIEITDNIKEKGSILKSWVKTLFWEDTKVTIKTEGEEWN